MAECKLRIKLETKLVKQAPQPQHNKNHWDEADLHGQLEVWKEQEIIEPTSYPWSSPLVAVKKKTSTKSTVVLPGTATPSPW